ncbi:MAG: ABC transporter ATP-binding protein [Planctomycetia bacterium]|nr:ABC transporter ATP-binding protein [Planctomycetia bacterium]
MQALWRVMKGVWPYRLAVMVGFLCALGVGLSYASGIATLLPVMKIFISTEGVHGWANQTAVQQRLHLRVLNLSSSVQENALAIVIAGTTTRTPQPLRALKTGDRIVSVAQLNGQGHIIRQSQHWQTMLLMLASAPHGTRVKLNISSNQGTPLAPMVVALPPRSWYTRDFVTIVQALPLNPLLSLIWVVVVFIILCIVGSIFRYYQQYLSMTIAARVVINLRRRMYNKIVQLPASYMAQHGTSDLTSRLTQDTGSLSDGVATMLGKTILEPAKALGVAGVALWIDWRLCLGTVLIMPIIGVIIRKFAKHMRKASRRGLEQWSDMLTVMSETLAGLRIVKAYSGEGYERRRFTQANRLLYKQQRKMSHYSAMSRPTVETVAVILGCIPILIAAKFVLQDSINKESFFFLMACFAAIFEPLRKLADVNAKFQQANAAATRIFEIIDAPSEPNYSHQLKHLPRHHQRIEFDQVNFTYPGHAQQVLTDISLVVPFGQMTAIVGGNGSGKTTLMSLLPRLYVPTKGRIMVDDIDTAAVSLTSLRKQIGLVTQETFLFADTIYNNIAYGRRHAARDEVLAASVKSYADEFIRSFPEGYDTRVGQAGIRLSGGQRQRIAIARAILRDPPILIFDEAMSQIDTESEFKIAMALKEFMKNRTSFVIAHHFSTIVSADVIICLDAGKIVGLGKHHELLAGCATYRQLYNTQFREVG